MKHFLILAVVCFFSFNGVSLTPIDRDQLGDISLQQQWGYTTVYQNVSLFWWLHMQKPTRPLLIWLGFYSTAQTNFNQYGPFTTDLERRNNSLVEDYNILFIDSMAGAGFSSVKQEQLYARSTHETTYDILMCIKSVFYQYPAIARLSSYIVADSFFAKIAPELAKLWHSIGSREHINYNLKGLVIGSDPYFSLQEKMWHNYELIKKSSMSKKIAKIVDKIDYLKRRELWLEASLELDYLFDNYFPNNWQQRQPLMSATRNFVNKLLISANSDDLDRFMNERIKNQLKLSSTWKRKPVNLIPNVVTQALQPNIKSLYEYQLKTTNMNIVFLNTHLDLKIHTQSNALSWINNLDLQDKDKWDAQENKPFNFNNKIKGIQKHYKNLYVYRIIQNSNSDFETNAKFLKTVFAEIMV